ncbi:MAG: 3-phosphoshikimate 1-carboxyvinyltransferase [Phycisphaerales bacterium]
MIDYTLPLDQLPDPLPIEPLSKPFDVTITPPGSKSITCRAYVLAALADGESKIIRPLRADDTDKLLDALCTLGAEAHWDGEDVYIKGVNGRFPRGGEVNLGDGGAPTRFMIACACLADEPVVVDGSKRMRERPIAEGVDMLRKLGAMIEYVEEKGRLPVRVVPSEDFRGGEIEIGKTVSSQFITAYMLVGSCLPDGARIVYAQSITGRTYVALTYRVLHHWEAQVNRLPSSTDSRHGHEVAPGTIWPQTYDVEPDASSAVYWWMAPFLVDKSRVMTPGIGDGSIQPDYDFLRFLDQRALERVSGTKTVVRSAKPLGSDLAVDAANIPDAAIALAVLASQTDHSWASDAQLSDVLMKHRSGEHMRQAIDSTKSTFTGLHTLRHKETDRIAALGNELRKIGCTIETTDDSITIDPSTRHDDPVVIETYNDHRMAMAFGVLGLARAGISISNPACVSKSYPTFWHDFSKLYQ